MAVITALEVQKRNKQRVNVFLDGEYAFSLSLIEAAKLRKGQTLLDADVAALRGADAVLQAVDSAAHFLGYRPRSLQEVRRNLIEKDFAPAVVEAAIAQLSTLGYVDDLAFARYWVQNRNEFKPLSPKALRQELRQKGVADAVIQDVLAELDANEMAYQAARGQLRRLRNANPRDFRLKLTALLQRRGFSYGASRDAIQRLLDDIEVEDPNYFTQETQTNEE
jgi:regulatory protein